MRSNGEDGEDCSSFEGNGKLPDRIQIGMESLGRYLGAGQVSIVERMLDSRDYRQRMGRREKIVIANVIRLAKELNIQVISEGIETKEHEQFLREIGCELAQGYLYGRPAPFGTYGDGC